MDDTISANRAAIVLIKDAEDVGAVMVDIDILVGRRW